MQILDLFNLHPVFKIKKTVKTGIELQNFLEI